MRKNWSNFLSNGSGVFVDTLKRISGAFVGAMGLAADAPAPELKDVRSPVGFPPDFFALFLILALLGLLLAVLLVRRFIPRWKKKRKETAVPPRSPWDAATEALERLRREDLPGRGLVKEYYTRLSDIMRLYMEGRFSIHAPEMTTEEFLVFLEVADALDRRQKEALKDFLKCSDMVKFARYGSGIREMQESFALAVRLIDETKPAAGPKPPGAPNDHGSSLI